MSLHSISVYVKFLLFDTCHTIEPTPALVSRAELASQQQRYPYVLRLVLQSKAICGLLNSIQRIRQVRSLPTLLETREENPL